MTKDHNLTPTDKDGTFDKPEKLVIGRKYHLSWAYKGAVFILKEVYQFKGTCKLQTPKTKKIRIEPIENLRELRKHGKTQK